MVISYSQSLRVGQFCPKNTKLCMGIGCPSSAMGNYPNDDSFIPTKTKFRLDFGSGVEVCGLRTRKLCCGYGFCIPYQKDTVVDWIGDFTLSYLSGPVGWEADDFRPTHEQIKIEIVFCF